MGRIAALDYGLKKIGIAISDERKIMALPLTTIHGGIKEVASFLSPRKAEIETIVIGLPLLMNGKKGDMALAVEAFGKQLEALLQIPVVFFDERLSSKHADAVLRETFQTRKKRDKKMDETAAALLLESYLTSQQKIYC